MDSKRKGLAGTDWFRIRRWIAYSALGALIWTILFLAPPETTHRCSLRNSTEIVITILFAIYSFMFLSLGFDRWKRTEKTKAVIASCAFLLLGFRDLVSTAGILCPTPPGEEHTLRSLVGSGLRLCYFSLAIITYHLAINRSPAPTEKSSNQLQEDLRARLNP